MVRKSLNKKVLFFFIISGLFFQGCGKSAKFIPPTQNSKKIEKVEPNKIDTKEDDKKETLPSGDPKPDSGKIKKGPIKSIPLIKKAPSTTSSRGTVRVTPSNKQFINDIYAVKFPKTSEDFKEELRQVKVNQNQITRILYIDELKTRNIKHAPSISNNEYYQMGKLLLDNAKEQIPVLNRLAIINGESNELIFHTTDIQISPENIRIIAQSSACEVNISGPCVLIQKKNPYAYIIGVNTFKNGSQEILVDYIYDHSAKAVNVALAAERSKTVIYSALSNKQNNEEQPKKIISNSSSFGKCTVEGKLKVVRQGIGLVIDSGEGSGDIICRYNDGTSDTLPVKFNLEGAGLGIGFDFIGNPLKVVSHLVIQGHGFGRISNISKLQCKFTSVGLDGSLAGIGAGADIGLVHNNTNTNERIQTVQCDDGIVALGIGLKAISDEGFASKVALRANALYITAEKQENN